MPVPVRWKVIGGAPPRLINAVAEQNPRYISIFTFSYFDRTSTNMRNQPTKCSVAKMLSRIQRDATAFVPDMAINCAVAPR